MTPALSSEQLAVVHKEALIRWKEDGHAQKFGGRLLHGSEWARAHSAIYLILLETAFDLYGYSPFDSYLKQYGPKQDDWT